jgi:hypothetical protein
MLLKSLQLVLNNFRNVSHELNVKSCFNIRYQRYARFVPRTYSEIVNSDELFDVQENTTPPVPNLQKKKRSREPKAEDVNIKEESLYEESKEKKSQTKNSTSTKLYENQKKMALVFN